MPSYSCADCGRNDFDSFAELQDHDCEEWTDDDPDGGATPPLVADGGEELHGTTEQKQQYSDVVEVTLSKYNSVELDSQLLNVSMLDPQDADFGVTIHQDGPDVGLAAGTVRERDRDDDRPHFHTYHALSIEQAREIADGLHAAADEAERVVEEAEEDEPDSDSRGFLRRLMS